MNRSSRGTGMEDIRYLGICTAVIGSMTLTMKAQNVLANASARVSLTKIGSSRTRNGCAYGIRFPCIQKQNVTEILGDAGIRVRAVQDEAAHRRFLPLPDCVRD